MGKGITNHCVFSQWDRTLMLLTRFTIQISTLFSPKNALLLRNECCGLQTSHLKGVVQVERNQVVLQIRAEVIRLLKVDS